VLTEFKTHLVFLSEIFWPTTSKSPITCIDPITRFLFLAYYVASGFALVFYFWPYVCRAYRTQWYDISRTGWLGDISWPEVSDQLAGKDPLIYKSRCRLGWPKQIRRDSIIAILVCVSWIIGIKALHFVGENVEQRSKYAAIGAAIASGIFALVKVSYDQRLKARSQNRQEWINELRNTIATLIENLPLPGDRLEVRRGKAKEYFRLHGKLELLINPHEKVHRALMAMIRHAYGHNKVAIDDIPREQLQLGEIDPSKKAHFGDLKSRIVRLSNVMLKREWERVKHIQ
jgi:hypothetical protein